MSGCDLLVVGEGPGGRMAACAARAAGLSVRRVAAADVWGGFARDEIAVVVAGRTEVLRPRFLILAPPPSLRPDGVLVPETGLARALGAEHRVDAAGLLRTCTDAAGRTSVAGVWALAGDGSGWLARAQGRVAGLAAAGRAGDAAERAGAALRRAEAAEPAAAAPPDRALAPEDVACPCEGVTVARILAAIAAGAASVPGVKRATRAGMGPCQGRLCFHTLHHLVGQGGIEARHTAPRAPIHPVRIGAVMQPGDAHQDPIATPATTQWRTVPDGVAPAECDALVVGAGIVGLCAALELARAGRDVVLIDRAEPGLAASTANAGSLHVQLLPYDFEDGDAGPLGEALALGPRSIALWRELAAQAGEGLGIRTEGGLVLAANPADLAWLGRKAAFERERGVETAIVGANELATLAPALARSYAGAAFCAAEGQMDPLRGTMAAVRLVREAGVRLVPGLEVRSIEPAGAGWTVGTSGGAIRAGQVLNAAGAHAGRVAALAGVGLPVRAVVQQVIATAPVPPLLRQLVAQARLHLSLKQKDGGQVVIGGGWPGRLGADGATRLLRTSIQGNLWTAAQVMPGLAELTMVRAWTGLTVHLDRGPVISGTPGRPGLFHAVTANGYTLGPVVGRMISEAMRGEAGGRGAPPAAFAL